MTAKDFIELIGELGGAAEKQADGTWTIVCTESQLDQLIEEIIDEHDWSRKDEQDKTGLSD